LSPAKEENGMDISFEDRGAVRVVTMSGADGLNVFTDEAHAMLREQLMAADEDDGIRVIVLRGTKRSFSVGADIEAFPPAPADPTPFVSRFLHANSLPERLGKPVLAVVEGLATAGGFELALACDWIFAGQHAAFAFPEARFGLVAGYAAARLAETIGMHQARRLLMTGETLSAVDAVAAGLPVTVVPDSDVLEAAMVMAAQICASAPHAVRAIKQRSVAGAEARDPALRNGIGTYAQLWNLPDTSEAIAAWRERRDPVFRPLSNPWADPQGQ
jgi:enoyl-CoA hydratase/carnithine racemase